MKNEITEVYNQEFVHGYARRRPTEMDVARLAENLREADLKEFRDTYGPTYSLERTIEDSINMSPDATTCYIAEYPEVIIFIGGVATARSLLGGTASPWLLCTHLMRSYMMKALRTDRNLGRNYLQEALKMHGYLENYVSAENKDSLRWLEFVGFTLDEAKPYGHYAKPFHRFYAEGIRDPTLKQ